MNHDHLPALKRYTSQAQYDALKSIDDTKSIKELVFSGSSNRTLGVLVRSAWINTFTYVKDEVKHEGWCVTDAGKHAMTLYAERLRIQEEEETKHMAIFNGYRACLVSAYILDRDTRARRTELELELKKLTLEVEEAHRKATSAGARLDYSDRQSVIRIVGQDIRGMRV